MRPALLTSLSSIVLLALAMWIGAGGHGFLTPSILISSPFLLPLVGPYALILTPCFWGLCGYALRGQSRWRLPSLLAFHYSVGLAGVMHEFQDDFRDPYRDSSAMLHFPIGLWLVLFLVLYVLGNAALWASWSHALGRLRRREGDYDEP